MASLDRLPTDQRAVLELVLQRGRSYDEIATMLSVDRAGVRQRALAAFDALGPQTDIAPERRGLIADYLLGQLPPRVSDQVRDRLGADPSERAWARMLASELRPIAREPLPEIPVEPRPGAPAAQPEAQPAAAAPAAAATASDGPSGPDPGPGLSPGGRRSSRLGGAIVLGVGAAIVLGLIAVLIFVVLGSSGTKHSAATHTAAAKPSSTSTSSTSARVLAMVNLLPPSTGSQAKGVAQVVNVSGTTGIVLVAQNMPPNKNNFYAVWLYNSASDYQIVGYVSPGVGSNGQLQTTGKLPSNASRYGQLLVAVQTKTHPKPPGPVVLQGKLSLP